MQKLELTPGLGRVMKPFAGPCLRGSKKTCVWVALGKHEIRRTEQTEDLELTDLESVVEPDKWAPDQNWDLKNPGKQSALPPRDIPRL